MLHGCVCVYVLLPAEKESERETEVGNDGSQKCGETPGDWSSVPEGRLQELVSEE